jgi:tetratricopeptide (TPR) repeat protein
MLDEINEWIAGLLIPRFKYYRQAKKLYLSYCKKNLVSEHFEEMTLHDQVLARQDNNLREAEQLFLKAKRLSLAEEKHEDLASVAFQLGLLLIMQGRYEEAELSLKESLEVTQNLPKVDEKKESVIICDCNLYLGLVACRMNDLDKANTYFDKAQETYSALGYFNTKTFTRFVNKCKEKQTDSRGN